MDGRVSGEMVAAVRPVGGGKKLAALEAIVAAEGVAGSGVMYVGDSITDAPPLEAVKAWGGVSLSFNGNGYALAAAEFAAASPDAEVQAQLARAFAAGGRDAVEAAVRAWPKPKKGERPRGTGARHGGHRRRGARGARRGLRRRAAERPRRAGRAPRLTRPRACPSPRPPGRARLRRRSHPALRLDGVIVWEWDARARGSASPSSATSTGRSDAASSGPCWAQRRRQVHPARRRRRHASPQPRRGRASSARPSAASTCARCASASATWT